MIGRKIELRLGESITINGNIIIKLHRIQKTAIRDEVRLGFDCPREVRVMREELLRQPRPKGYGG